MTVALSFGKLILFGEHAVVHGQPAIAVPLKAVNVRVTVEPTSPGKGLIINLSDDPEMDTQAVDNALKFTVALVLAHLGYDAAPDLKLILRSTIPMAAGFGSGAAVSTALARALSAALGSPLSKPILNDLIYEVEKIHHGTPSGIDNTVIVYEQPVYFQRGSPIETFQIAYPFQLVIGQTAHATPTYITVGDVRTLYEREPVRIGTIFQQIGEIAESARHSIEVGDLDTLGTLMNENHLLLRELTVSDVTLDRLCEAAYQAGALGTKLSGGGRGGNMIALVTEASRAAVEAALLDAGAVGIIHTVVGDE